MLVRWGLGAEAEYSFLFVQWQQYWVIRQPHCLVLQRPLVLDSRTALFLQIFVNLNLNILTSTAAKTSASCEVSQCAQPFSLGLPFFWFPLLGEDFPMWMVPISICTSDDPTSAKMQVLMDKPELTLVLKDVKPDQWVKVSGHKGAVSLVVTLMFSFIPASSSLSFSLQTCISHAGASLCYCWILAPVCNA